MAELFNITHNAGNLSEYSSTVTDSGDLSAAAGAALAGTSYGLSALINDTNNIYGQKDWTKTATGVYRVRFYLDPNSLSMSSGAKFTACYLRNASVGALAGVVVKYSSGYKVYAYYYDDAVSTASTSDVAINDTPNWIEYQITRASSSSASDGVLSLWVNGGSAVTCTGIDNYDRFVTSNNYNIRMGFVYLSGTISGAIYSDELVVNDDGGAIGAYNQDLVIADAAHAHAADNVTLTQHHTLAVSDASHGHTADGVTLAQHHILAVGDAGHGHAADNVALTQSHALAVADAAHAHAADNVTLVQRHVLVIADAAHAQTADNVDLTQHETAAIALEIADASHAQTADNVTLAQHHALAVADAVHAQTADGVTLAQRHRLALSDGLHSQTADGVTLTQHHVLVIADAAHAQTADNVVLVIGATRGKVTVSLTALTIAAILDTQFGAVSTATALVNAGTLTEAAAGVTAADSLLYTVGVTDE